MRTIAWVLVIIFIPIFGLFLYHLIGKNIYKEKTFKKKYLDDRMIYENLSFQKRSSAAATFSQPAIHKNEKLIRLLESSGNTPLIHGNKANILNDGASTFDSIHSAIKMANKYVHLEYYIFLPGKVCDDLVALLAMKVKEGVAVRIIYDGVGSWKLDKAYIQKMRDQGIEVFPFMPVRIGPLANRINYRNHRKIIVVDGIIGFTGGINVADKYVYGDEVLGHWQDIHLRIEGPAVEYLNHIFLQDWFFVSQQKIDSTGIEPKIWSNGHAMQVIASGPDSQYASIQQEYFAMINEANEYIYITTPYFIPGTPIIEALKVAAISGVEVILLLPRNSDSKVLKWSVRSYLENLLEAGVRIFLYQEGFLHSKTIVSDDYLASIGTANLDQRSFTQNFEVNVMVYGKPICQELKTIFYEDLSRSKELFHDQFHKRPINEKFLESTARLLSPLL